MEEELTIYEEDELDRDDDDDDDEETLSLRDYLIMPSREESKLSPEAAENVSSGKQDFTFSTNLQLLSTEPIKKNHGHSSQIDQLMNPRSRCQSDKTGRFVGNPPFQDYATLRRCWSSETGRPPSSRWNFTVNKEESVLLKGDTSTSTAAPIQKQRKQGWGFLPMSFRLEMELKDIKNRLVRRDPPSPVPSLESELGGRSRRRQQSSSWDFLDVLSCRSQSCLTIKSSSKCTHMYKTRS